MTRTSMLLVLFVAGSGCASHDGIVYTDSNHGNIVNGIASETAELRLPADFTLIVPENAKVVTDASVTDPVVKVKMELAVFGHPTNVVSIKDIRHTLGVATKTTNDSLMIATFGEYTIEGAGGARVDLKILVPEHVKWKRSTNLCGPNNASGPRKADGLLNDGWSKIETRPAP